jgi:hypothetical protein
MLGACLLYCLVAPNEYEAIARVALRGTPVSVLTLDRTDTESRGPGVVARQVSARPDGADRTAHARSANSISFARCNSRSLRVRSLGLGIGSGSKLVVLGEGSSGGVDLLRFSPGPSSIRRQLGIPRDALVIGFVGRLTADKGLPELLEAFTAILGQEPSAYLLLAGWFDAAEDGLDVGMRARIEGHPRIVCTGFVADTAPYYRSMDVMVLPSWREGFPNVVLEAAASGVPVVATYCTGSRDAVISEVTGLLVPPGYPDAICEAVLGLLRDPVRCQRMSTAARRWVIENYEDRRVLGLAVAFYLNLIRPPAEAGHEASENPRDDVTGLPVSLELPPG